MSLTLTQTMEEVRMGQIEMQNENKRLMDLFTKRVTKAALKE